jgi:hypothetical protein
LIWIFNLGRIHGAGDRDRTGDIQLGKLAFYRARVVYLPNAKPVPRNGLSGAALQVLRFPAYSALIACCDRFYTPCWTVWTVWFWAENIC